MVKHANKFIFSIFLTFSSSVSAQCDKSNLSEKTLDFFEKIAPLFGVPVLDFIDKTSPILASSFYREVERTKSNEKESVRLALQFGEDAWPSQDYFFVGNPDGFNEISIKLIDEKKNIVEVSLKASEFSGVEYRWIDRLHYVSERGRCVLNDIVFEDGSSSRERLRNKDKEYLNAIHYYKNHSRKE